MKINQWSLALLWIAAVALLIPPSTGGTYGGYGGYGTYPIPPEFGPGYSTPNPPPIVDPTPNPPPSGTYTYYSPPTTLDPTLSPPSSQSGSGGGGGYSYSPPYSDTIPTPSIDPGTGSPPFSFDPNSPPFTCNIWGSHPTLIWGLLGYWGTVGTLFGAPSSTYPAGDGGSNMSLQEALLNTRPDPIGALYREGTASLLNSMATTKFPYSTNQVRDRFVSALSSNKAAAVASQAHLFKLANEGHLPSH